MLSAVAARKARLAQSQTQNTSPALSAPSTPPSESKKKPLPPSTSQKPPSSKRKSSTAAGGSVPKKKRSEQRRPPTQPARYFAQADAFKAQEDVIVVDDSDAESSVSSHGSPMEDDTAVPPPPVGGARRKRAWSPSAPLPDTSDEDSENGDADEPVVLDFPLSAPIEQAPAEPASALSTFDPVLDQTVFHFAPGECPIGDTSQKSTALLLSSGETVALLGTYALTVLRGSINLAGVQLFPSTTAHRVYAPRSSPIPLIQCRLSRQDASTSAPLLPALPQRIADASPTYDATILLQELHTGIDGLGRICRTFDGCFAPARWHRNQARVDLGLDTVYPLERQTPDVSPLVVPPSWDAAIGSVIPPPSVDENELVGQGATYLVRGPKNAGKSTFARLLLNRLLSRFRRVAYLECDLGQSEFTPGGMVSLNVVDQPQFGPPFSHPSIPYSAHYIGATSPKNTPSHYLDAIQALVHLYRADLQNAPPDEDSDDHDASQSHGGGGRITSVIPLVVNTMGWTKGLGADLGRKVEDIIEPARVFSFAAPSSPEDDWHAGASHAPLGPVPNGTTVHTVTVESVPPSPLSSYYTAADHRNIALLSYLHAVFDVPSSPSPSAPIPIPSPVATTWATALPLCAQPPYQVDCAAAFDALVLTGAGMEDVVPSELPRALPCALVALVSCEPGTLDSDSDGDVSISASTDARAVPYTQGAPPPSPYTSRCLGLALVRGVSSKPPSPGPSASASPMQLQLQLLTPIPAPLLSTARALVMGEMQLPVWGMLDFRTLDSGDGGSGGSGGGEVAGVERGRVPYLRWGRGAGAGGERRRVRRNLMRRGQM